MDSSRAAFTAGKLNSISLADQIAERIEAMITANRFNPGDRLPSGRELAALFGVNPVTVGRAVAILEQRGLVRRKLGQGSFVERVPHSAVGDAIARFYRSNDSPWEEVIDLREILEPEAAVLAARNADDDDLRILAGHWARFEELIFTDREDEYVEADTAFHMALATASHNRLILAILGGLYDTMKSSLRAQHNKHKLRLDWTKHSLKLHRRLFEKVTARDAVQAGEAARELLRHARVKHRTDARG